MRRRWGESSLRHQFDGGYLLDHAHEIVAAVLMVACCAMVAL